MRTYASSRVKRKSFYRKKEPRTFLLISGGHTGRQSRLSTNMVSPYNAPQRCVKTVSANNSETVDRKELRFGQVVYILVFL